MNPRFQTLMFASLLLVTLCGVVWSQAGPTQEPAKNVKEPRKEVEKPQPKEEPKDPTSPSPKLKELLHGEKAGKGAVGPGPKMPIVALRGRVISKNQPAIALLEVEGRFYSISKGSSLPGGGNTILRILEITSGEVRIEVLPLKEIIVLK